MILGIFQNGIARKNPLVLVKIELLHTAYIFYIYIEFTDYIFTMEYTDIECTDYVFTMEYSDIECTDYMFTIEYSDTECTDYVFTMEYSDIECTDYMFTMEYLDIECADYEDDILVLGEKSGNVSIYQLKNQVTWKGRQ